MSGPLGDGRPVDPAEDHTTSTASAARARSAGILLHVTSLPAANPFADWGIGDLGPSAHAWIDRLAELGLAWWQVLPLGPTGFGNSPYQALSSFAGNELLVSPESLLADGLLTAEEALAAPTSHAGRVDFNGAAVRKEAMLDQAWANWPTRAGPEIRREIEQFREVQAAWLEEYALYRALKDEQGESAFQRWPAALRDRDPPTLRQTRQRLRDRIDRHILAQFLLARQMAALRLHAGARGVRLLGDLPFFVADDSCDVWAAPEFFQLDGRGRPLVVAGVPPDAFSADGQRWGNPVYDWTTLAKDDFGWWLRRLRSLLAWVDAVRLDHFRGYAAAWHIPAKEQTARNGRWVPGPGPALFEALRAALGGDTAHLPLIAEDLGFITPDVVALRQQFGFPGIRVLQFGFDDGPGNIHHPDNFAHDVLACTGTHDNPTTLEWVDGLDTMHRKRVTSFLGLTATTTANSLVEGLIGALWASMADTVIVPLQDVLVRGGLGAEARMNTPGRTADNWTWRATPQQLADWDAAWLAELTQACSRRGGK